MGTNKYDSLAQFRCSSISADGNVRISQAGCHTTYTLCIAMFCNGNTSYLHPFSPAMPGGRGTKAKSSSRTVGLTPLFHTVDLRIHSFHGECQRLAKKLFLVHPLPNPNPSLMMRQRAMIWNVIRQNQALYDAAHKFGLLPFSPPEPPRV